MRFECVCNVESCVPLPTLLLLIVPLAIFDCPFYLFPYIQHFVQVPNVHHTFFLSQTIFFKRQVFVILLLLIPNMPCIVCSSTNHTVSPSPTFVLMSHLCFHQYHLAVNDVMMCANVIRSETMINYLYAD